MKSSSRTFKSRTRRSSSRSGGRRFRVRASNPTRRTFKSPSRRGRTQGSVARRAGGRPVRLRYPSTRRNPAGLWGSPAIQVGGFVLVGGVAGYWVNRNVARLPMGETIAEWATKATVLPSTILSVLALLVGWKYGGRYRTPVMAAGVGLLLPEVQARVSGWMEEPALETDSAVVGARRASTADRAKQRARELQARIEARRAQMRVLPSPPREAMKPQGARAESRVLAS